MRLIAAALSTVVICGLLIFGARTIVLQYFGDDAGNNAMTLTNPVSDSEKAYNDSVIMPIDETEDGTIEGSIAESSQD